MPTFVRSCQGFPCPATLWIHASDFLDILISWLTHFTYLNFYFRLSEDNFWHCLFRFCLIVVLEIAHIGARIWFLILILLGVKLSFSFCRKFIALDIVERRRALGLGRHGLRSQRTFFCVFQSRITIGLVFIETLVLDLSRSLAFNQSLNFLTKSFFALFEVFYLRLELVYRIISTLRLLKWLAFLAFWVLIHSHFEWARVLVLPASS